MNSCGLLCSSVLRALSLAQCDQYRKTKAEDNCWNYEMTVGENGSGLPEKCHGIGPWFPIPSAKCTLSMGTCLFQRAHVDYESILHVLPEHAVECLVDLLDRDDFDFGHNIFLAAIVEHLLRLRHAANHRARDRCPLYDQ